MSEYKPIVGGEALQMQFLYSLYRCMKDDESLKPRLQSINMWWRYRGAISNLHALFGALWDTVEPNKRERLSTIWQNQELRITNKAQAVDPSGDLIMIPKSAVAKMALELQETKCAMCFGGNSDRKECAYRRALIDLAIPDLRREEKKSGKCVGHLFDWRSQE